METTPKIRLARREDVGLLQRVEERAAVRFEALRELQIPLDPSPADELIESLGRGLCWIAESPLGAVGMAYATRHENAVFIEEISVVPEAGGQGLGRALVHTIEARAAEIGAQWLTLTTFREVPWNAPWYLRLGFDLISCDDPAMPHHLRLALEAEIARGFRKDDRVAMRRVVTATV